MSKQQPFTRYLAVLLAFMVSSAPFQAASLRAASYSPGFTIDEKFHANPNERSLSGQVGWVSIFPPNTPVKTGYSQPLT